MLNTAQDDLINRLKNEEFSTDMTKVPKEARVKIDF
jgi:hypothetical protein